MNHHDHVRLLAQISLTLTHHPSLSPIALRKSSRLHPVLAQCCCIQVLAGLSTFAHPCERVHRSTSPMSSSLLLQQCPTCLVHLTWIVFLMSGRWLYSSCFVGYFLPGLVLYSSQHSWVPFCMNNIPLKIIKPWRKTQRSYSIKNWYIYIYIYIYIFMYNTIYIYIYIYILVMQPDGFNGISTLSGLFNAEGRVFFKQLCDFKWFILFYNNNLFVHSCMVSNH